jgi:chondroitin AC lyase
MAGQVKISGDLTIGIDGPGLLLLHTDGTRPKSISVEDPSRNLSRIHLTTSFKIDKKGTNFSCTWNEEKKITEIAIDLPQTVYAGKSVTAEL